MRDISACPVCGADGFSEVFPSSYAGTLEQASAYFLTDRKKAVHGRIVRCDNCSFVLTSPQYEPEEYDHIYRNVAEVERTAGRDRAVSLRYQWLADCVRAYAKTGRYFDFGCGEGEFLDHLPGFEGVGLELRPGAIAAQKQNGNRIIVGEFSNAVANRLIRPASFDFVTMWDVLEHLSMLSRDVSLLGTLLKPHGWLFCSVPNVASYAAKLSGEKWNCYLLEHLWYFSPRTLCRFFERHGFARCTVRPFLFPTDLATLASRFQQTYGVRLPVPKAFGNWTVSLPAGMMFGAFQLKS